MAAAICNVVAQDVTFHSYALIFIVAQNSLKYLVTAFGENKDLLVSK